MLSGVSRKAGTGLGLQWFETLLGEAAHLETIWGPFGESYSPLDEAHHPYEDPDSLDLPSLFPPDVEVGATAWALHLCRQVCVRESGTESEMTG